MDREVGAGDGPPVVVLVASPDPRTRAHVTLTLGDARFRVVDAADTDEAVRGVATDRPQLLVLDADLPGAGSVALARTVRSQPETAATCVLVLTARGVAIPVQEGVVDATLAAPFTAFSLLHKVEALLAASSTAQA
jgi:DNA-binding response OmpR family regulator